MDISVNENLVLLALWNWFTRPSARNGKSRLQHHLELFKSSPRGPVAGYTWEDVTAYLVRHWFSGGGKQLDHIFRVMNGNFPFASQNFQLAQMLTVDEQGNVEAIISTQGNTLGGSTQSHTPAETLKLLLPSSVDYNLRRGYAIVKPDVNMGALMHCYGGSSSDHRLSGPDLCFVLVRSDGTRILVNIQCKDRSEQLSSEEVYTALDKLKPDGWWPPKRAATTRKTETPVRRQKSLYYKHTLTNTRSSTRFVMAPLTHVLRTCATCSRCPSMVPFPPCKSQIPILCRSRSALAL